MGRGESARDAAYEVPPASARRPVGDRWAVVVGISDYRDDRLDLRYAHRDARALEAFLQTPAGGAFAPERMRVLVDGEATTRAVTRAIRSFLGATREDDLVVIYFACHGVPDARGARQPLYLLTADADLDDVAGTALPMDEIDWCLRNYVRAARVVIIADTCHSAGLESGTRGGDLSAASLNRYLDQLSASKPGVAYLTSARADQRSLEDEEWGSGHGAFTWFLLEGLRGAADGHGGRPRDGVITLAELAGYVRDQVFAATGQRQEPMLGGGRYDPELPLAVAGGLDVEQHLQLARALLEVGWLLDDPAPFRCAAREATRASELAGLTGAALPSADALAGEALLAAEDPIRARDVLGRAHERFGDELDASATLHLGLALAEADEPDAAAARLGEFAERAPDDPEAGWAADYARWIGASGPGVTRALLIGVGSYELPGLTPLAGPPNDVPLFAALVRERLGVAPDDMTALVDGGATRAAVVQALTALAAVSSDADRVLVYFSGHADANADPQRPYLILHDAPDGQVAGVSVEELHRLLAAIPARARALVLDTHGNAALRDRFTRDPVAGTLVASRPAAMAYDVSVDGRQHGALTAALVHAWRALPAPLAATWGELARGSAAWLRGRFDQVPVLIGDPEARVFEGAFPGADLWRLSRARAARPVPPGAVAAAVRAGWPRARRAIARARMSERRYDEALELLPGPGADEPPWAWLEAAEAAVAVGRPDDAIAAGRAFAEVPEHRRWGADPGPALRALQALRDARPQALLVGIGRYADPAVPDAPGTSHDVAAMRRLLLARGFEDITVLEDADATREAIVAGLSALAPDRLAVLFVAAHGSSSGGLASIVPHDGRGAGAADLTLAELAGHGTDDLVTVLDAGCGFTTGAGRTRAIAEETPTAAGARDLALPAAVPEAAPTVGAVTLLVTPDPAAAPPVRQDADRGLLTQALVRALETATEPFTYAGWARAAETPFAVVATGAAADEPVLVHRSRRRAALAALRRCGAAPAVVAADLARREAARAQERNDAAPATHLELGLAHAAAGAVDDAVRSLRTARNLYDDPSVQERERARDGDMDVWHREARYHLGRLLHQHREGADDLNDAVASLRQARRQAPDDPRILLHLGLAIRALVERQSLVEANELLRAYVEAGAPLGRLEDVSALLAETTP